MNGERADGMRKEVFLALAAMLGLEASDGHLEELFPEVTALLERVDVVHGIDTSTVPVEHAVASHDGGTA